MNPSLHVYTTTLDYILSNKEIAAAIRPANITRYDKPGIKRLFKQDISPADLPDLIFQQTGFVPNRRSSSERVEQYDFQATITTGEWDLKHAAIAHVLIDWLYGGNDSGRMCGLDWGEDKGFFKCEVLPMQIANHMPTNRNLSGFVYAVYFNIQLSALTEGL